MEPFKKKILEMMVKKEEMLAQLYRTFADKSRQNKEFWAELAEEEKKHAEWISKLAKAVDQGSVSFEEGNVKTYTLETFLKHVAELQKKASSGKVSDKQALTVAIDLEQSLMERNTFSHFIPKTNQAAQVIELLKEEQERHIDRVVELRGALKTGVWSPGVSKP